MLRFLSGLALTFLVGVLATTFVILVRVAEQLLTAPMPPCAP